MTIHRLSSSNISEQVTFQHQPDAVISQANPVNATLYEVLATTKNVRIITISAIITWATTQPSPLEVIVTIDGQTIIYDKYEPVTATYYGASTLEQYGAVDQILSDVNTITAYRAFLLEGRSVRVQVRINWATTQPTPLVCRVKYAKIP